MTRNQGCCETVVLIAFITAFVLLKVCLITDGPNFGDTQSMFFCAHKVTEFRWLLAIPIPQGRKREQKPSIECDKDSASCCAVLRPTFLFCMVGGQNQWNQTAYCSNCRHIFIFSDASFELSTFIGHAHPPRKRSNHKVTPMEHSKALVICHAVLQLSLFFCHGERENLTVLCSIPYKPYLIKWNTIAVFRDRVAIQMLFSLLIVPPSFPFCHTSLLKTGRTAPILYMPSLTSYVLLLRQFWSLIQASFLVCPSMTSFSRCVLH